MLKEHQLSNDQKGINAKLLAKYVGQFTVKEVKAPNVYILEGNSRRRVPKVHVSQLNKTYSPT